MTLREWLTKRIDFIRKRGCEPLDTYGDEYRRGYSKACRDIRDLLDKADLRQASTTKED